MSVQATRTIEGKVLNQLDGAPVLGARVQAWELNWTGDDEYVGESLTTQDGSYRLVHDPNVSGLLEERARDGSDGDPLHA